MTPSDAFDHPLFAQLAALVFTALFIESLWLVWRFRLSLPWGEQAANVFVLLVGGALRVAVRGFFAIVFVAAWNLTPLRWERSWLSALVCFLLVDLLFYGWHRFLHHHPLGFALHTVHHSGETFTLSLAGRLPWPLRLVDDLIIVPVVLLGFDPLLTFLCMGVSFTVQFLVHTNTVGRLPLLDLVFNTPSNHRVHHHADGPGQRHNYGAALIIWDRLFGTYLAEPEGRARFGLNGVPSVSDPLEIQLQGFKRLLAQWKAAR
jgi:sterol desaturase/sphingolipid hydroxylase (fatty acid hydroxylase superfamily)